VPIAACKDEDTDEVVAVVAWMLDAIRLEEKEGTKPFVVQNVKELPKKKRRIQIEEDDK
jgi:hypothetical protein